MFVLLLKIYSQYNKFATFEEIIPIVLNSQKYASTTLYFQKMFEMLNYDPLWGQF